MRWLGAMNRRDRMLMTFTGVCAVLLIVVIAVFGPARESSPVPSTYSNGAHGARAAYLLLRRAGYRVVQSTAPLGKIADKTTPETTFIFADPFLNNVIDARKQIKVILARGGRVLVTGVTGAMLVPEKHMKLVQQSFPVACNAQPQGLSQLASSRTVRIVEEAAWKLSGPEQRVVYRCGNDPVVVTFSIGKGTVVWWASASPLENATILQKDNLGLLLNSIGPRATTRVVWDESLHGVGRSLWSWTEGTALPYVWWQFALAGLLLIFSFSRRSGPLRPDPVVMRAAPLEFAQSLGALYKKAGAANIAVLVAYQNFRLKLEKKAGIARQTPAGEAVEATLRRYPGKHEVAKVIEMTASATKENRTAEHDALKIVRALQDAENELI